MPSAAGPKLNRIGRPSSREEDLLGTFLYNEHQKWIAEAKQLEKSDPRYGESYRKERGYGYRERIEQNYREALAEAEREASKPTRVEQPVRSDLDKFLSSLISGIGFTK